MPDPSKPVIRPLSLGEIGSKTKSKAPKDALRDAFGLSQIKSPVQVSQDLFPIVTQPLPGLSATQDTQADTNAESGMQRVLSPQHAHIVGVTTKRQQTARATNALVPYGSETSEVDGDGDDEELESLSNEDEMADFVFPSQRAMRERAHAAKRSRAALNDAEEMNAPDANGTTLHGERDGAPAAEAPATPHDAMELDGAMDDEDHGREGNHGESGEGGQRREEDAPTTLRSKERRAPRKNSAEVAEVKREILSAIKTRMSITRTSHWFDIGKLVHGNIFRNVVPLLADKYSKNIENWASSDRVLYGCVDSDGTVIIADGNHRLTAMKMLNRQATRLNKPRPFDQVEVIIAESLAAAAIIALNAQCRIPMTNIEKIYFLITHYFPYFTEITAATTQKDALEFVQAGLENSDYTDRHVSTALAYRDNAGAALLKSGAKNNLLEHIKILVMFARARRRNAACAHAIFKRYVDITGGTQDALMKVIEKNARLRDALLHALPNHAAATVLIGELTNDAAVILDAEEKRCVQAVRIIGIDVEDARTSGLRSNALAVCLLISKDGEFMVPHMVATWGGPRGLRTYMTPKQFRNVFGSFSTTLAVGCSETLIATLTAFRPLVSHVQYVQSADVDGRLAAWKARQSDLPP